MAANGNTLIQSIVPDELRGRVIGVYMTVFAGSTPIGGVIAGALASALGAAAAIGIGGASTLAVGAVGLLWLRRHQSGRLRGAPGVATPEQIEPRPEAERGLGHAGPSDRATST
jgi:MFS family permease